MIDLERGPRIVCFPSSDLEMRNVVQGLYASIPWVTPDRLQAALREIYPTALVRRREVSGEPMPTWYVFRDPVIGSEQGRWPRSLDRGRAWGSSRP